MSWIQKLHVSLTILQIGTYLLLLTKLFRSGLWTKYRYFSFYIAFESIRLPLMSALPYRSKLYAHTFFATQPIVWILFVLVVLELFQLVLQNHAGIASLGRKALTWSLIVSALISGSTLLFELQNNRPESALLFNFFLLDRLVMSSLFVLLLCLIAFLTYFPVPLVRNIRVHASVFSAYFAARTILMFVVTLFGLETVAMLNVAGKLLAIFCLLSWTFLLTRAGELAPVRQRPTSEQEARLLAQLEALNDTLMRSARK
jgi:hypothetical protein